MNQKFKMRDIVHALGVSPATADRITGLLNGTLRPQVYKSIDPDPLAEFGLPQDKSGVMTAIAEMLNGEVKGAGLDPVYPYIDLDDSTIPTVVLYENQFLLTPVDQFIGSYVFKESAHG